MRTSINAIGSAKADDLGSYGLIDYDELKRKTRLHASLLSAELRVDSIQSSSS
jgi:hypothetical protein